MQASPAAALSLATRDRGPDGSAHAPPVRRVLRRNDEIVTLERRDVHGAVTVVVTPHADSSVLTVGFVHSAIGVARQMYGAAVSLISPALTTPEADAFLAAGFRVRTELALLSLDLTAKRPAVDVSIAKTETATAPRLRRFRASDQSMVLDVDLAAFGEGAEMDAIELTHALEATPSTRARVAVVEGRVVGYQVFGRSERRGYLQRLAVEPQAQGRGIAQMLIHDGLRWCQRHRVQRVVVNTERENHRALRLYEGFGFQRVDMSLVIVELRTEHRAQPLTPPAGNT